MAALFSPLQIRGVTFRNRITVSPMCEYSAENGFANDWHLVHLGSRAVGGAGLIITEAVAVSREGRISPSDLGLWDDAYIPGLKRITDFLSAQGAVPGIQLAHAGRKSSTDVPWKGIRLIPPDQGGWKEIYAPSAIAFSEKYGQPIALSKEEITRIIHDFKAAAKRSLEAGFKVIEVHGAHGYLVHQFLSPLSNHRTDEYGGGFDNRIRFMLEIVDAVREVWPAEYPLFVRISATDWAEGGWNLEESTSLARILKDRGVDLIDTSSGGLTPHQKITVGPLYQTPFAAHIRKEAGILTGAVGLITTPEQAASVIADEQADLVLIARASLRDPYFPMHAADALGEESFEWPVQYERAKVKH
ncbi:NADH:flavin oxidoreductase/NADH oxidase [Chitinophaga rhizophila]|uniref:NADH:flavin oxidoreductase/NADH oxidase n=1 Tax=Chitinophaga rhizophila TaxID=2866212 RepID=A0ABS7GGL2_9BACT|nr:NADH:flavin oxidoreductase/NADH oxidase [Chitinophaga rhizophila]MBW8686830.1 NADH:flavin oxidoreductase/NADH oxidase [Chitinophaga rhizophila]